MSDENELNKSDLRIVGDRLIIAADVDLAGLRKLRKRLRLLEPALSAEDEEEAVPATPQGEH